MSRDPNRYLTPPEVAARLGCKAETVIGWIRNGELRALNVARRGTMKPRYRVSPEALELFELTRAVVPREPVVRQQPLNIEVKRFV